VEALRDRLGDRVRALPASADPALLAEIIAKDRPDACVLATGTHHHQALARVLWRNDVPFVACCAYPQARFFEVMVVHPALRTPCYECFRGHLHRGAQSRPIASDEVMQFLYARPNPSGYRDLVAEPASAIETGRVADVAIGCLSELLAERRAGWFERLCAEETTCLIGGNTTDVLDGGEPAYGITRPGQVVRVGLDDLVGDEHSCSTCARKLRPAHRVQREVIDAAAEDAALLRCTE
jgi:hypothetical protein